MLSVVVLGLAAGVSGADLKVDYHHDRNNPIPTPEGWVQVTDSSLATAEGITVELSPGQIDSYHWGPYDPSGDLAGLINDHHYGGNTSSFFTMTITGLDANASYQMTSWHNVAFPLNGIPNAIDIKQGADVLVDDLQQSLQATDSDSSAKAAYTVMADGSGRVVLTFTADGTGGALENWGPENNSNVALNGFTLALGTGIGFEQSQSGAVETITAASLAVILDPASTGTITVDYAVTGGTATNHADYILEPGTLTFLPTQTRKTIDFTIIDDSLNEPDETIIVAISNLTGGESERLHISRCSHVYTIVDPRPHVSFAGPSGRGSEDGPPAEIAVIMTPASDGMITVDYAATGGTAATADDYILEPGTLTFSAGQTVRSIILRPLVDELEETDETVEISLSTATGTVLIGPFDRYEYVLTEQEGIQWDALTWYRPGLTKVSGNELYWHPEPGQMAITTLPEMRLSQIGDVAEISYFYMGQGDGIDGGSTGTGDIRMGLFDSNGMGYPAEASYRQQIFCGYLGYKAGVSAHVSSSYGGRIAKRIDPWNTDEACQSLIQAAEGPWGPNRGQDEIPGFELPPEQWSLLTLRCERTTTSTVIFSVTLNGRTETLIDSDQTNQPRKIDVFAMYFANDRPYTLVALDAPKGPKPSNPNPRDEAPNVNVDPVLSWRCGRTADSQDVYFGTDQTAVTSADRSSGLYMGNRRNRKFLPGPLDLKTTYYWRIDDVNDGSTVTGDVWSFTTTDCAVIDDFEGDFEWEGFGSAAGYTATSGGVHHGGIKSMQIQYLNIAPNPPYAAAGRTFDQPQDWLSGPRSLGLYFRGAGTNSNSSSVRLYLRIEDAEQSTAEVVLEGADLTSETWQPWGIQLNDLSAIDHRRVKKVTIGIGSEGGTRGGEIGSMYIDDVGLCRGRCVSGPPQDLTGDCLVNFLDHAELAEGWSAGMLQYRALTEQWLEEHLDWP